MLYSKEGNYTIKDLLDFLEERKGLLDAVVLSGGEATSHSLLPICQAIKKLGFKIKLDSNGLNHDLISELVEKELIDYIALDFKAPEYKFEHVTQTNQYHKFKKSLTFLIEKKFDFEVRTTLHADLLNTYDVNQMISTLSELGYDKTYYLQHFLETPTNVGNIKEAKTYFDESKIVQDKLVIEYRNTLS